MCGTSYIARLNLCPPPAKRKEERRQRRNEIPKEGVDMIAPPGSGWPACL